MQTIHPVDDLILDMYDARRLAMRAALDDGTITAPERAVLDTLDTLHRQLSDYRARQVAAASFERNGDSRLTVRRFHDAGFRLVEEVTETARVIAFPTPRTSAG
jgi:hypothetical protein